MSVLTDQEIAVLIALNNWGPGPGNSAQAIAFLDTAIAVCRAESSGNPNAVSATHDYGLWQINKTYHPEVNFANIFDPLYNTSVAKGVYNAASGWTPWSTYKSGAYRTHLGAGAAAYKWLSTATAAQRDATYKSALGKGSTTLWNSPPKDSVNPSVKDLIGAGADATGLSSLTGNIFGNIYQGMKTVGIFLLALVVLVLGLVFLLKDTSAGKAAKSAATDAAKVAVL